MNLRFAVDGAAGLRCAALLTLAVLSVSCAQAQAPTQENVEKYLKSVWEKKADSRTARTTLKLNSVKFGKADKATAREVLDGAPRGAMVTPAIVDFSVTTYNSDATRTLRRAREGFVFIDKFGEWMVMTGSVRGQDQETLEPVKK